MFSMFLFIGKLAINAVINKEKIRAKNIWMGMAVEEGFEDRAVFDLIQIASKKVKKVEDEKGVRIFHYYSIDVTGQHLTEVMNVASHTLRSPFCLHLVKGDEMKIVFRGKTFEITKGNVSQLQSVRSYAMENGVGPIRLQHMFNNPYLDE